MRKALVAIFALVVSATSPAAQQDNGPSDLNALMTAVDAKGWEGVGLITIGQGGMCTGALIEPNVVLTAGHCLYDVRAGTRIDPAIVMFHAGWRNGRATATRRVRRAVVHPDYEYTGPSGDLAVANDLALLELDSAISLANVVPFAVGQKPRKGQSVGVVSYAHDRADSPSIQKICHVLARQRSALVLSCDIDFGSSGAPIFIEIDGRPQIVSVISAKANVRGRKVSLGTNLEKPLTELRAILRTGGGQLARGDIKAKTVKADKPGIRRLGSSADGAKFLRP